MSLKKDKPLFFLVRSCVKLFYPRIRVLIPEEFFSKDCVFVGNHAQIHGPLSCELYLPNSTLTWCAAEMMNKKEVPAYAYRCFWEPAGRHLKFYKVLSRLIAPLCECLFSNARTLPVYTDERIITTFRKSIDALCNGQQLVLFPETEVEENNILNEFHPYFVDLARLYYKRTKKTLSFVPLYVCPARRELIAGEAVCFNPEAEANAERERILKELHTSLTGLARSLPEHEVVPFLNTAQTQRKNTDF